MPAAELDAAVAEVVDDLKQGGPLALGQAKQLVTQMYEELRERADCTTKANTCEQYSRCTDDSVSTN